MLKTRSKQTSKKIVEFHSEGGIFAWHSASPLALGSYRKVGSRDANELFCDYDRRLELAITHTIRTAIGTKKAALFYLSFYYFEVSGLRRATKPDLVRTRTSGASADDRQ
jgi:hypothetical protein